MAAAKKVYIASFFNTKARLTPHVEELQRLGFKITAEWLKELDKPDAEMSDFKPDYLHSIAQRDKNNIRESDIFIIDTLDVTNRGGREVELGMALSLGLFTILVGPIRNVFHYLTQKHFETWEEALSWLKG